MRIKKIQLKNGYKRFFNLTIDLGDEPKRIIALIGPNGSGKSSVFDGMLFYNSAYGSIGDMTIAQKGYEYHSMDKAPNYSYENIIIDFIEGSFNKILSAKQKAGIGNTIFSFRSPYRYNSNLKVTQSSALPELRLNNYGAKASSDLDAKMGINYRRLNIKYNRYLHDQDCTPSQAKTKIIGDLNNSLKNCLDLEITGIGNIESGQGSIYFKKSDQLSEFDFNVLSSGEKEVVDILLDLYLRADVYNDTVFLLNEPELHVNTSIQKKLIVEINNLIGPNCQLWIATHSIGFLRALQG